MRCLHSWFHWPLAVLAMASLLSVSAVARAEDEDDPPSVAQPDSPPDETNDEPKAEPEQPAAEPAAAADPDGPAAEPDAPNPAAGDPAAEPDAPAAEPTNAGGDDAVPAALEYDADGDGKVEQEEAALQQEYAAAFQAVPDEIKPVEPGETDFATLAQEAMTKEEFQKLIRLGKAKVLERLQAKMAKKQDERMAKISTLIALFSLSGLLLLFMPLVLRKKYPGQGVLLFKYSALAAVTFVVTVNFFGGVVLAMRGAQSALGERTNPQLRVAEGFFTALDEKADDYRLLGKTLFGPTLKSLQSGGDEQPAVVLLENGQKLLKDAKVFKSVANGFKKIDFVFAVLPIVLLAVTMLLFVLAIKPTLIEIVKMPAQVAAGASTAGSEAIKKAGRRVVGELLATVCTVGVLVVLTLFGAVVLGTLLPRALDILIQFFSAAVLYLQVADGASSGLIFVSLFSVILFLVLNLAALILSTAFFLGKSQKIFQQRFHDKVALREHARFWKWGSASVLVAQLIPVVYIFAGWKLVELLAEKMIGDGSSINWTGLLLGGPVIMVAGFALVFWLARGLKAIKFLATYKVKT